MKNTKKISLMLTIVAIVTVFACLPRTHASDVVIQNTSTFTSSIGTLHVVGEVQNSGADSLKYVEIVATFYNQSHVMIGTDFTFTLLDALMPGNKSPFDLFEDNSAIVAQIASYSLTVTYQTTNPKPPGLEILSNSSSIDILGYLEVVGEVQNLQSQQTRYVEVIITFYNSTGAVVGCDYTFSNPTDLAANQTAPYKITFIYTEVIPNIAYYELTAQSQEYSVIPENMNLAAIILAASSLLALATLRIKRKTL